MESRCHGSSHTQQRAGTLKNKQRIVATTATEIIIKTRAEEKVTFGQEERKEKDSH
jgi:hypothetical protein